MGLNPNSTDTHGTKDGRTLLHHAAELGDTILTRLLISSSANVDMRSAALRTPLHEAAYAACGAGGHLDCIKLLLDHKAPVDAADSNRATPLILAVELRRDAAAMLLVEHGASLTAKRADGTRVLDIAKPALRCSQHIPASTLHVCVRVCMRVCMRAEHK